MIKKAGNEFSGATTGRDDRSTWVVGLVNFGKKVHDRRAWCGGEKVLGSFRKVARGNEVVNGVRNGGLMDGCQMLVLCCKKWCHLIVGGLLCGTNPLSRQPRDHPCQQP